MTTTPRWRGAADPPRHREGIAVALKSVFTLGLYYAYWVHRLHREMPSREGVDSTSELAVGLPVGIGLLSIVPVLASGILGDGEVHMPLFITGMAINFVAHLIYLRVLWKLTDRLALVAEATELGSLGLSQRRWDAVLGILSITIENIGLKSIDLLALDVPEWVGRLDSILLGLGVLGLVRWSRSCLLVANIHSNEEKQFAKALGVALEFQPSTTPGQLGVAPRELSRKLRGKVSLIRRTQWMTDDNDEGFGWFLSAEEDLKENGIVVPGTIIQANVHLFREGPSDHPGELVFSLATPVDTDALDALSRKLGSLKGETLDDPKLQFFSDYLADEMERVVGVEVPDSISPLPEAYVSTTIFYRHHLPGGRLGSGMYPLLVSPASKVAMVLPMGLWTQEGYDMYLASGGHPIE